MDSDYETTTTPTAQSLRALDEKIYGKKSSRTHKAKLSPQTHPNKQLRTAQANEKKKKKPRKRIPRKHISVISAPTLCYAKKNNAKTGYRKTTAYRGAMVAHAPVNKNDDVVGKKETETEKGIRYHPHKRQPTQPTPVFFSCRARS
jgi:uncharacterized Rmd1/YagE family protein